LQPHRSDIDPHAAALDLIPWHVNGTLDSAAAAKLLAHLEACAACRRDYEAQLRVCEAMQADSTLVFAAEPSFKKLLARIGTAEDAGELASGREVMPAPAVPVQRRFAGGGARWLAAAVVLETLGLGYGAWVWHGWRSSPASTYVTLTSAAPSYRDSARVRIVFRSGLSVQGLGSLLHDAGAHIIDGPTDSNVYTLGFSAADVTPGVIERRVAALRTNADVLFAEPLGAGIAPR
jgi:hypothetical protein